jgi:hypothetical protein
LYISLSSSSWNIKRYQAINGKVKLNLKRESNLVNPEIKGKGIQTLVVTGMVIC